MPEPTDVDYWIQKPTQRNFSACCNEFWWCLNNVAKGLWREEIPYVQNVYYGGSHAQFMKLLNWKIGYETKFQISTGKASKYMQMYLPEELWNKFLKTYISGNLHEIWESVFLMCDMFNDVAIELEQRLNFHYNRGEAEASYKFLKHVYLCYKASKNICINQT